MLAKTIAIISAILVSLIIIMVCIMIKQVKRTSYIADIVDPIEHRRMGLYEKYIKRVFDFVCASGVIIVMSPLYLVIALLVKLKLGSPIIFKQERPGLINIDGKETIFKMYKFRTMTDEKDENGELLSDEKRLTKFGAWLRKTSLDELPEVFNILNGTMSIIGPRPQLVRDMTFMTKEHRARHTAKPGLSGLAQVNGRNAISWDDKLDWDLKYIKNVSFLGDIKIIYNTIIKALIKQEGIVQDDMATAEDYGDYLLRTNKINREMYDQMKIQANMIINRVARKNRVKDMVSIIMPSYNTAQYIYDSIQSVLKQTYQNWELIIVDDCSTDNTDEVFSRILDDRIRFIKNDVNSGAAVSRNKALQEAKGQWIAFLDSDDLWKADKLECQISFMKKNGYCFSYTNYEEIDADGNKTGIKVTGPRRITKVGMYNYCWPGCLTVMYDAEKVGLIQIKNIKKNNDYAMWLKVSKKYDCFLLDEYLAEYRKGRKGSISNQSIKTMIGWHYKLFREAEGQGMILAGFNTCKNMFFGFIKKITYVKR